MPQRKPQRGDLALHRNNQLDARPVSGVSLDGKWVVLRIGRIETSPLFARNYTFTPGETHTYAPGERPATAGNNRKVHLVRESSHLENITVCGVATPRRPQSTDKQLPKCKRCFG